MASLELLDNDILFKIACFDLVDGFAAEFKDGPPVRLVVAAFVLGKRIKRSTKLRDKSAAHARLGALLAWAQSIEPDEAEVILAAEIETQAQIHNIPFDGGESLLLAILLSRHAQRLYTGDKRAIEGLPRVCHLIGKETAVAGRIRCFEQVLLILLDRFGASALAARVCREPEVDKATSICCRCASGAPPIADEIATGLGSYVMDLRRRSGMALAP